jgi:hypothetical protein
MAPFTIDSEDNIAAHAAVRATLDNQQAFATENELAKLSAEWPGSRLVDVWNSFAGVAGKGKKSPTKAPLRARAQKGAKEERSNKKAEVLAMMKRAKGGDSR